MYIIQTTKFLIATVGPCLTICLYHCRIQITISLSGSTNTKLQAQNIFPFYVLLARPTSNISLEGVSVAPLLICATNDAFERLSVD
jgi:hypothetical protein